MRNFLSVSGAALAASLIVTAASAEVLGTKFIDVDRFKYAGNLVVGVSGDSGKRRGEFEDAVEWRR